MIFSVFQKNWVFGYSWSTLLWYWCYYPHRSRDALSPVCGIFQNENTKQFQVIFSIRSKTIDLKTWRPWQYENNLCVKCGQSSETMDHFVSCLAYGKEIEYIWKDILEDDKEKQKIQSQIF